ncbi:hypothetical protein [Falsiroseomonas tokyonensis]|uniref:Phage tail protein n=1 Tax=Falsiroseomonas tokyonensis TaxID=430521 RepID=A0ABV7C1J0_9PROT|nr:hypothetical protein [Falsiroseomonas tokyonensis]MBU8540817.1 hypothetical protein [Falsiroseomonas tokyonensis]
MSTNLIRMRNAAFAAKIETTAGADAIAGTPAAGDWLRGDITISFNQSNTDDPTLTGSLDSAPGIVGGLRPTVSIRLPLRGSGTAGTAPEWGKLLACCAFAETVTSATVGAPTAAASGTTTSITLASPFGTTAQQYRGMPLTLSGNLSQTTGITDYTTGRVATLGETLGTAASTSTSAQIPINVLYSPTSDESVYKTATFYFYADGLQWIFVGNFGSWSIELTTGGLAFIVFEMRGQFLSTSAVSFPASALSPVPVTPPRWVGGISQLNRVKAQVRTLRVNAGVLVVLPDDPEAVEGVGIALPTSRASGGSLDPYMNVSNYVTLFDNFRNGVAMPLMVRIGNTAGNRFLLTLPRARVVQNDPTAREGLGVNSMSFQADGPDAGVFLCSY